MAVFEIFSILNGGISLVPAVADVVNKLNETSPPTLKRVIDTVANDTSDAVEKLQISIDRIESMLHGMDIDMSKKMSEPQKALSDWDLINNFYLNRAKNKISKIQKELRSSIEEVGRILMCRGEFKSMEDFDNLVRKATNELNKIEEKSIYEVLAYYRELLLEYQSRLR